MKKFFEKYDLLKISGIMVLLSAILTWLIPYGYFSGSEMVTDEITRVGFIDFAQQGLSGIYFFAVLVTFLFVLGGFYQVLSKRAGYQKLIKTISEKLKGKEIPFVLITSLVFAILTSLVNEYFPLLVLVPFVITILNRLKVDKISAFVSTFGGMLVGTLGSTFSTKVVGQFTSAFTTVTTENVILTQTILFVIGYLLVATFTLLRMRKRSAKDFEAYDKFELEKLENSKKAPKTWAYVIGIVLFIIVTVLAYLPWETWNIKIFTTATDWINELSVGGVPFLSYVFSKFTAFGKWEIAEIQVVMIAATLLIHWFGRMSLDEIFESFGEGFKKMGNVIVIMLCVYLVVVIAVSYPVIPVLIDWIATLTKNFNSFIAFACASIASLFSVEAQYSVSLAGNYFATMFKDAQETSLIVFQSAWGWISFFAPSSVILMMGLSYLNIPYKDWMKFIWKFLLIMLVIIFVIIILV